ncbi:MAG: MipA/OmpV family protein [Betaproteobacteria bacterium]
MKTKSPITSPTHAPYVLATCAAATGLLLLLSHSAWAQSSNALPLWEVGAVAVGVSQQAYPGSSERVQQALALPFFIYRGDVLRLDGGNAGLRAFKTPTWELDIGASGSLGSRASDTVARKGMADLGTLVEFGPRLRWNISRPAPADQWRLDLPLRGVFDLNSALAQRGIAFEPELSFSHRTLEGTSYSASVSGVWANQSMQSMFYSVAPSEVNATRSAYTAQAGLLSLRLAGSVSHLLNPDLRLIFYGRVDSVNGSANQASPLVQQNTGASMGMVLSYTWKQSEARASD